MDGRRLSPTQMKHIANLRVQAMLFDMEIDWEAGTLIPKQKDETPYWLKKWRSREHEADRHPKDYEGGEDERR